MKNFFRTLFIIFLLTILTYTSNITMIPKNIILFQGEKLSLTTILGVDLIKKESYEIIETSTNISKALENVSSEIGKIDYKLNLFNTIPIKEVSVNVIPKTKVVPVGQTIGLKLYTKGVLVVGMSEVKSGDNKNEPYINSEIKEGDTILTVNEKEISSTEELVKSVNESKGENLKITYSSEGEIKVANIKPGKSNEGEYKLGLWVRDAAAGVGTISFYEPSTKTFAALGHGIQDVDTEKLITISNGEIVTANIIDIRKGKKGKPGEIRGNISSGKEIGEISKNTAFGIYGKLNDTITLNLNEADAIEVASRDEITTGPAKIICTLQDNKKEEYNVEIQRIDRNNNENNKSMLLKVIDKDLIEKTGGIIQGMSGSPIVQNGKFIGAVTHVLVNEPTMGYGVFADIMIKTAREVE